MKRDYPRIVMSGTLEELAIRKQKKETQRHPCKGAVKKIMKTGRELLVVAEPPTGRGAELQKMYFSVFQNEFHRIPKSISLYSKNYFAEFQKVSHCISEIILLYFKNYFTIFQKLFLCIQLFLISFACSARFCNGYNMFMVSLTMVFGRRESVVAFSVVCCFGVFWAKLFLDLRRNWFLTATWRFDVFVIGIYIKSLLGYLNVHCGIISFLLVSFGWIVCFGIYSRLLFFPSPAISKR